jgi:hypothetical protein
VIAPFHLPRIRVGSIEAFACGHDGYLETLDALVFSYHSQRAFREAAPFMSTCTAGASRT